MLKKTRSPAARRSGFTAFPIPNCSRTSRGSVMPCCANTYHVKPLQSKPFGSAPPFLYGAPLSASAVPVTAYTSAERCSPPWPIVAGGEAPPGVGKGRGTAPVDAHAADIVDTAHKASAPMSRRLRRSREARTTSVVSVRAPASQDLLTASFQGVYSAGGLT